MFQFTYPAKIKKDEAGFFLVTFPDIPFAATDGKTMAEALEEARDCLEEAIAVSIADNLEFPFPSSIGRGQNAIPLTARMSAKAALYIAVRETGISKSKLARGLVWMKRKYAECFRLDTKLSCRGLSELFQFLAINCLSPCRKPLKI